MIPAATYTFNIAELSISVAFNSERNDIQMLSSFKPFRVEAQPKDLLFQMDVVDYVTPASPEHCEYIREFDDGNGNIRVDRLGDGGYQYIMKDLSGYECGLLQTNKDFSICVCALRGDRPTRAFALNNALLLTFAFAGSRRQVLLIHASLVRQNGQGYAFIAKSGTGKSTHTGLWLRYISGCDLMNDDNPVIRIIKDIPYIYGTPWSGKTPCYRDVKARLGAITRIDRAKKNSVERLTTIDSFMSMLASCTSMKWDEDIYTNVCNTISKVVETTGIYTLHCLPNKEAAILCNEAISK